MPTLGTVSEIDRACARRSDEAWLQSAYDASDTRVMILIELKAAVVSNEAQTESAIRWFSPAEIAELELQRHQPIFLGVDASGRAHFALAITEHRARVAPNGPYVFKPYVDLRSLAVQGVMNPTELSLVGLARALAAWHVSARCCGHCGSTNNVKHGGWLLRCWSCGQSHFPRTDPVVIMLVTDGDRCLLGRDKRFPDSLFSALAGFVEPGEDLEAAVRREVMEEVGIEVGSVTYQESQPWPFPHSLMIGCQAEALTTEIRIDPEEIEDARWMDRSEIAAMINGQHDEGLSAPGRYAIARKLLLAFIER